MCACAFIMVHFASYFRRTLYLTSVPHSIPRSVPHSCVPAFTVARCGKSCSRIKLGILWLVLTVFHHGMTTVHETVNHKLSMSTEPEHHSSAILTPSHQASKFLSFLHVVEDKNFFPGFVCLLFASHITIEDKMHTHVVPSYCALMLCPHIVHAYCDLILCPHVVTLCLHGGKLYLHTVPVKFDTNTPHMVSD